MKYPEIQRIIDTMTKAGYDYKKEIEEIESLKQISNAYAMPSLKKSTTTRLSQGSQKKQYGNC